MKTHSTTIVAVKKDARVAIAGDGQVTLGNGIIKNHAKKVRLLAGGKIVAGFAGSAADGIALLERLEQKLDGHTGNL
ncbi:HslU--HslV peptidase proteolytic subunit, partial [Myxococcota bacterium]|nr:HslU--HslV peptidase proteolytic subunit [Myxococcota bacterium]